MKHSIKKIFSNLNLFLFTLLALSILSFVFIVEQHYSYKKVASLNKQKTFLLTILNEVKKSNTLDIIKYNEQIANIKHEIEKLRKQNQYNYIANSILQNNEEYNADLDKLTTLIKDFDKLSREYFDLNAKDKNIEDSVVNLKQHYLVTAKFIESMIFKNIAYDNDKFSIYSKLFALSFILLLITTLWYKKRLSDIYKDISLLATKDGHKDKKIFSQEVDTVLLRINRKTQASQDPSMIDPITEINNNKGMIQSYAQRKGIKDSNFSSITVLEIDNFSKTKRAFSQEFTQAILKKVAYTISLHQQATDIIARSDYNQFTLIFSRPSKEQLFKHTDLVRQSIAEIKLMSPEKEAIQITVTGGFINKVNNAPLDESIRKAKELLQQAKLLGKNRIIQTKDLPK